MTAEKTNKKGKIFMKGIRKNEKKDQEEYEPKGSGI